VTTVDYLSPDYYDHLSSPQYRNLSNPEWRSLYGANYVSGLGELVLVVDDISLDIAKYRSMLNNTSFATLSGINDFLNVTGNKPDINYLTFAIPDMTSEGWIPLPTGSVHIANASARVVQSGNSSLEISLFFMLIVIVSNLVKAIAMLVVLLDERPIYLVTVGDAVASFLENPDPVTLDLCTLSKDDILLRFGREPTLDELADKNLPKLRKRLNGVWMPRKRRLGNGISGGRLVFGFVM
jgi:hypothetical protein